MLMALLPLAGWAQVNDLDGATVVFAPVELTYNGTAQALPTTATVTKAGSPVANVHLAWTDAQGNPITTATNVGTYNYRLTADSYSGHVDGTYEVVTRLVKVQASAKTITYGDPVPTFTAADWTYAAADANTGFVAADLDDDGKPTVVTGVPVLTTNYGYLNDASTTAYKITPNVAGMSASNYRFGYVEAVLTVNPKNMVANDETKFTIAASNDTYDGEKYEALPEIWDVTLNKKLVKDTDYELSYFTNDACTSPAGVSDLINYGTYYVKATGMGNYSDATSLSTSYKVTKKSVAVYTSDLTTTYGIALGAPQITYDGFLDADFNEGAGIPEETAYSDYVAISHENTDYSIAVKYKNKETNMISTTAPTNAGSYDIIAYAKKTGSETLPTNDEVFTNYKLVFFNGGTATINKKTISYTVKPITKSFGESLPVEATNGVLINSNDLATEYYSVKPATYASATYSADANMLAEGDAITSTKQGRVKLTIVEGVKKVTALFAVGDFEIKHGSSTDVTSNYAISPAYATWTVEKGDVTVKVQDVSIIYGDDEITSWTIQIAGGETSDHAAIQEALEGKVDIAPTGKSLDGTADVNYPNAGVYALTFTDLDVPTALSNKYNFDQFAGKYTIKKAHVNVAAKPQMHMVGEAVTATASAETIGFELITDTEDPNYEEAGAVLPSANDLSTIYTALSLEYNGTAATYTDSEYKLVAAALEDGTAPTTVPATPVVNGVYYNGIAITAAKVNAYNTGATNNYLLHAAAGQLTVTPADIVTLAITADNNSETIEANKNKKLNVRISGRTLYANQWNAMTLPFDINPLDFCKAVNAYAVFDVLQETGTAMNFKITINEIPAFTPFLVKVDNQVALTDVVFNKVTVKAVDEDALTQSNEAYSFVGTVDKDDYDGALWIIQPNDPNGNINAIKKADEGETYNWVGFNAYITPKAGNTTTEAPVIIVEEADGSTTAISAIDADGVAVKAEGWYTINGVKLQSAPTEKGVYINNGKKIVVK